MNEIKSRRQLINELEVITSQLNARCDEVAAEIKGVEDELNRIWLGVPARFAVEDEEYGFQRVGERWRLVLYFGTDEDSLFKPLSDCSREDKIVAGKRLDAILQAIVNAATERLKEVVCRR